ncbi:MAG: class I SAM-dependent methyltransferase [Chloroflexota bacterium]
MPAPVSGKDYLWLNLRDLPYFRAVLRAVEARFYDAIELPEPCLDLGCGDGHFASIAFKYSLAVGLDPWSGPLREAAGRRIYRLAVQGSGALLPFENGAFSSVVSNSVLEHIPDLQPVLVELNRVLQPGGLFVFCVPNHRFLPMLSVARWLERIKLVWLAGKYRGFFNRISRHFHCDDNATWTERLNAAGFKVNRQWDYFSPQSLAVLEWGHYFGLPALVCRALFKRWIIAPAEWNLQLTRKICEPVYNEEVQQVEGVYSFYIAQKIGDARRR